MTTPSPDLATLARELSDKAILAGVGYLLNARKMEAVESVILRALATLSDAHTRELAAKDANVTKLAQGFNEVLALKDVEISALRAENSRLTAELAQVRAERDRLHALVNSPELIDFQKAVVLEAAHQRERWGSDHDAGKTEADWFWLLGYVAGKALSKPEKRLHHIITTAAVCANWHAATMGLTDMRPGISEEKQKAITP